MSSGSGSYSIRGLILGSGSGLSDVVVSRDVVLRLLVHPSGSGSLQVCVLVLG